MHLDNLDNFTPHPGFMASLAGGFQVTSQYEGVYLRYTFLRSVHLVTAVLAQAVQAMPAFKLRLAGT